MGEWTGTYSIIEFTTELFAGFLGVVLRVGLVLRGKLAFDFGCCAVGVIWKGKNV